MKKRLSLILTLLLVILPTVRGIAEEIEISGEVDAEVMPAEWAGDTGLTVEGEAFPAEVQAQSVQEEAAEPEAREAQSLYWRVAVPELPLFAALDAPGPFAAITHGSVVLMLEGSDARARIAFNSTRGIVEAFVERSQLEPLTGDEAAWMLNELAVSGMTALYQEDLNRPLPTVDCIFYDAVDQQSTMPENAEAAQEAAELSEPAGEEAAVQPVEAEGTEPALEAGATAIEEDYAVMAQEDGVVAATDLSLSASKISVGVKEKYALLTAQLLPENSVGTVTWRSKSTKIAKVNATTGVITGVKAGTTIVYAKLEGGVERSCKVTVKAAPKKVTLNASSLTLSLGQAEKLSATLTSNSASALTYTSSNSAVASVDADGVVTGVSSGTATITVKTFNGKKAKCAVTVVGTPQQVFLPESLTVAQAEHKTVTASVVDETGAPSAASYTFSAANGTGAITINAETGEIVGVTPGTATVRVTTHNGVSTHMVGEDQVVTVCEVTVVEGPTRVGFASDKVIIGLKQSFALNPVLLSDDGREMEGKYTIESSDKKKLSVSSKGVIKGLSKGTYTVTATAYNGVTGKCTVKVVSAPSKVTIKPNNPVIGVGQTVKLTASFPKNTMASCTYSSSATKIVSVDKEGNITGLRTGSAVVKAKTHNGKTAKVTVTVTKSPNFIALNGDYELVYDPLTSSYSTVYAKTLNPGESFQITYENEYQTYGDVASYESDSPEVAEVSQSGLVTAKAAGTAMIVVRSTGGAEALLRVTVPGTRAASIAFDATTASVVAGKSAVAPSLTGSGIDAAALAQATYFSDNGDVFTVAWSEDEAGWLLTGVNPGTATLTATAAGAIAQLTVSVTASAEPAELRFPDSLIYMGVGESVAPEVTDEYENLLTVSLASSDPSVISVGASGTLTALAEGEAVITASYGSLTASMTVRVRAGTATISLNQASLALGVGQRFTLKAQVNGDGASANLAFASSDPGVASVSRAGRVIARGVGSATITATVGSATASCAVTVGPAPTRIAIEPASVSERLDQGGVQLKWSFGAPDELGTVTFAVADSSVASVSAEGYVTFKAVGATRVTAKTSNGLSASIPVTVLPSKTVSEVPSYRLFAAYSYFDSSFKGYIPFTKNNATSVAGTFAKSSIGGLSYSTKVLGNPSKTQLLSGIGSFFASAGDNDISIVYLCSHGHMTGSYTGYRMSLPGYDDSPSNANYYMSSQEIMDCVSRINGSVVLILDSCYSGTFLEDMSARLDAEGGRIAVLTAASDTRATYYKTADTSRAVDFFTFFMLQGLGYDSREGWWTGNAKGSKGSYPGYLAADQAGNGDGIVTLGEMFDFASKSIAANIPNYMTKSWYWGDATRVQVPRFYAGSLGELVVYQPKG